MQVKIRIKCTNLQCQEGMIYGPHCKACGERIPDGDPWWKSGNNAMPCGHSARRYLVEEWDCPACLGTTWMERWIDVDQVEEVIRNASKSVSLPA